MKPDHPLRLAGLESALEISAALDTDHDVLAIVDVNSHGFAGHTEVWLCRAAVVDFVRQLSALNRTLKGEARLASISPDELALLVHSVSSRGHIAVSGACGFTIMGENAHYWHAVSFGFEIEIAQLGIALTLSWLAHYGNPA